MNNRRKRDDGMDRLFFLLQNESGLRVKNIKMVKPNVWLVTACEGCWVAKRYRTFCEAMRQAVFMQALKKAGVARVPEVYTAIGQNGVFWRKALFGSCKHIFLMRKDCHLPAGEISPMGLNGCKHTISSRRCWPAFRCFKRSFRTTLFLLAEKPWFLHALLFPADMMREWRFALRRNKRLSVARKARNQFVREIIGMIK